MNNLISRLFCSRPTGHSEAAPVPLQHVRLPVEGRHVRKLLRVHPARSRYEIVICAFDLECLNSLASTLWGQDKVGNYINKQVKRRI